MDLAIRIRGLHCTYGDGTAALKGVDLNILKGQSVGLIGPNGAGKTTLLLHLNGILRPQRGSVEVLGMEVEKDNLVEIRKKVGMVFQEPDDQLFCATVFDDVAFGPVNVGCGRREVREKVASALREVNMEDEQDRCSHHLSLGEKRRVSIATVLSMEPEILILDEPSSNLDPKARRQLINLLNGLRQTRIIAGHDLELIRETCKTVFLLDKGLIVAEGSSDEILSSKELLESHGLEVPPSLLK